MLLRSHDLIAINSWTLLPVRTPPGVLQPVGPLAQTEARRSAGQASLFGGFPAATLYSTDFLQ